MRSTVGRLVLLRLCLGLLLALAVGAGGTARATQAKGSDEALRLLATGESGDRYRAIALLGEQADERAAAILRALADGALAVSADGRAGYLVEGGAWRDAVTGEPVATPTPEPATVPVNNRARNAIAAALASLRLFANGREERLAAARELQQRPDAALLPKIEAAIAREKDREVAEALVAAAAQVRIGSADPEARLLALETLAGSGRRDVLTLLERLAATNPDGSLVEPDPRVRAAAIAARDAVERRLLLHEYLGRIFAGLSLGSILMLAAMGLAITYGLLGVINMAHGEMIMIGAYATFVTQSLVRELAPGAFGWYPVLALPVAFVTCALVGVLIERLVIRFLYGRPLETLLATWGISLILIQSVRQAFGPQNVGIENPAWMSGGVALGSLVLPWNRIVIIAFALLVLAAVALVLARTRLGLFVRGVTQNRSMAGAIGVPTGRVDMLAFGLGSGIAGLAGVALSQVGNVGPELGQAYIIDSFIVVVAGGVGQLSGAVAAGMGLGVISKFIEPSLGAVIAKIVILVAVIAFIQRRPQGLFALRERGA
ncbi:MAG: urea ABC transporter permease subunit UrtB [Burkholderiaceae bacterium]|nr:urea ABC transporter permease subunit UrtB [Burkholderiaceae bacterium]